MLHRVRTPFIYQIVPLVIWYHMSRAVPPTTSGAQLRCPEADSWCPTLIPSGSRVYLLLSSLRGFVTPERTGALWRDWHPEMFHIALPPSLLGQSFRIYEISSSVIESGMSCAHGGPEMPKAPHIGTERRSEIYFQQVKVELRSLWPPHPPFHLAFKAARKSWHFPPLSNAL